VTAFVRSVLAEPRAPDPPAPDWRDWALVGALMVSAVAESIFRTDVPWRPLAIVVALLVIPVLPWRRTHPLFATAVGFGGAMVLHLPLILDGVHDAGLYTMVCVLLLPYALYRWASGREALIGTAIVAIPAVLGLATSETQEDLIGGTTVLVAAFALGAAMRYRAVARGREVQQVRTLERGELARELHDTVAHHVSAIAIQAQAGRAVAATDPAAALDALAVIEAEASRTLSEMRTMVRVLRDGEGLDGDAVEYAPQRGIGDLDELTRMSPLVRVQCVGDLADLPQPVEGAVYRICQESVTNAIRHALHPTKVGVEVRGEAGVVRLRVHDDGQAARPATTVGYGLLGMAERAKLLGGACRAGPDPVGGWTVEATLPREVPR
jgi:signal transduction histidine kinase